MDKVLLHFALKRFWLKVDKSSDCWNWKGAIRKGYGSFYFNGKSVYAHRFIFQQTHELELPIDVLICHNCDNPKCVNPKHLYPGSAISNQQDCVRRGRKVYKDNLKPSYGVLNKNTKLNDEKVKFIRFQYPIYNMQELVDKFGVSKHSVWKVLKGDHFKYVPPVCPTSHLLMPGPTITESK